MAKKSKRRSKHIPRRTCVGCREVLSKRSLVRIVNGPEGVRVDPTGKAHGRGAYLHDKQECWLRGIHGALGHALKTELTNQEKEALLDYMNAHIPGDEREAQRGAEGLSG
ncbi:MAG: YlxR family protein [Brevefilum sp.]